MACSPERDFTLTKRDEIWLASFTAMAGPCEIHIACSSESEAGKLASLALSETRRIEQKFSRYRDNNPVHTINHSNGQPIKVDDETARLLRFAYECHALSEGLFDITSGVLRRAWTFNGQEARPDQNLIRLLLQCVGWEKVTWDEPVLTLLPGMEIDLGGVGKEYAVDRVVQLLSAESDVPLLVNFGGDIRTVAPESHSRPWTVGIEDPLQDESPVGHVELENGAVATSGDSRRFCTYRGRRLGHILNPTTGWPVENAPRSVTVAADTCLEAGFLATLAMLQGFEAEDFLAAQEITHHIIR